MLVRPPQPFCYLHLNDGFADMKAGKVVRSVIKFD